MEKSQTDKLYDLLKDGKEHRTDEIMEVVYGGDHLGLARVGARAYDCKVKYNVEIKGRKDKNNPALYWYQLVIKDDIDRMFKEIKPVFGDANYVEMWTAYNKYQKAGRVDKKRLADKIIFYYGILKGPQGSPSPQKTTVS